MGTISGFPGSPHNSHPRAELVSDAFVLPLSSWSVTEIPRRLSFLIYLNLNVSGGAIGIRTTEAEARAGSDLERKFPATASAISILTRPLASLGERRGPGTN